MSHDTLVLGESTLKAALHDVWAKHAVAPRVDRPLLTDSEKAETAFLSELSDTSVDSVYHAIRQMPYGGVGVRRTVEGVLEARCGSCSGKHMALTNLLRRLGHKVELLTLHCNFATAFAASTAGVPAALMHYTAAPVHDFHHVVRLTQEGGEEGGDGGGRSVLLDATWPDSLAQHGFRVNTGWSDGDGGTLLAVPDAAIYQRIDAVSVAQLGALKAELVATLPPAEVERRTAFFGELLVWLADLQQ